MASTSMLLVKMALLVCVACCWAVAGHKPMQLTDSTFEGVTQASTGQTTGHWFVLFACPENSRKGNASKLRKVWAELADETWQENSGFQVAEVNSCENGLLSERFDANITTVLLFRDRKMYKYPLTPDQSWPTQTQTLQQFATSGYQQAESLPVPPPKSLASVYWSLAVDNMKELHALGIVPIVAVVFGFIIIKCALYVYLNERKAPETPNVQKKQS